MAAADAMLIPVADDESAGFWEGVDAGELRLQACGACGRLRHPPRPMCPWCQSTDRRWQAISGRGVVWSVAVPHPPLLPAFAALAPYNVVVVALDEDPSLRLVGNVVPSAAAGRPGAPPESLPDLDQRIGDVDPSTIEIGARVHVVFGSRRRPDGSAKAMPYFVLDAGASGLSR